MKILIFLSYILTFCVVSLTKVHTVYAALPSLDLILSKTATANARPAAVIEQELVFEYENEKMAIQEIWTIEGDRNLKLLATGKDVFSGLLNVNTIYNSKNKIFFLGKNKQTQSLPTDFYTSILFFRSKDRLKSFMAEHSIDSSLRLSRADRRINFAIGKPTPLSLAPTDLVPGQIWIDQDEFLIRKVKYPSGSTVHFHDFTSVNTKFSYPKTHVIQWAGVKATVKVKKWTVKESVALSSFQVDQNLAPTEINILPLPTEKLTEAQAQLRRIIYDFYTRFR